jgi:hypothetical protein
MAKKKASKIILREKKRLFEGIHDGEIVKCPVCTKKARLQHYSFGMNEGVALISLISAVRWPMNKSGYAQWKLFYPIRNGLTQLNRWGLATSRRGGFWKPTELGIEAAYGRASIVRTLVHYNNVFQYEEGPQVFVADRFKDRGDYEEGIECIGNKVRTKIWVGRMHRLDPNDPFISGAVDESRGNRYRNPRRPERGRDRSA